MEPSFAIDFAFTGVPCFTSKSISIRVGSEWVRAYGGDFTNRNSTEQDVRTRCQSAGILKIGAVWCSRAAELRASEEIDSCTQDYRGEHDQRADFCFILFQRLAPVMPDSSRRCSWTVGASTTLSGMRSRNCRMRG